MVCSCVYFDIVSAGVVWVCKFGYFMMVCSHGEALTFEPLLVDNKEASFLRDYSIVAIATVTQVLIVSITSGIKGLTSLSIPVSFN